MNTEDGSFITCDAIREAADRLDVALKAVSEGSFKSDRKRRADVRSWHTGTHRTCARHGRSSMEAWLQWRHRDISKPTEKKG